MRIKITFALRLATFARSLATFARSLAKAREAREARGTKVLQEKEKVACAREAGEVGLGKKNLLFLIFSLKLRIQQIAPLVYDPSCL
jgi:hypothetical protein